MFKKLIAVMMAIAMATCTAIPVYADPVVTDEVSIALEPLNETAEIGESGGTQNETANDSSNSGELLAEEGNASTETVEGSQAQDSESQNATQTTTEKDKEEATDNKEKKEQSEKKEVSKYQKGLAAYIRSKNKNLSKSWSITLAGYFIKSGNKHDIDPTVLMALARRESNFRAKAKSAYGYKGMMQCSDSFARSYGYKPSDLYKANVSIEIAAKYLKTMKKKYGTYSKAISCYICGSGAVARGTYSKAPARSVMNMRTGIKEFLKEKGYTS